MPAPFNHPPHNLTSVCGGPVLDRFTVPGGWLYRTTAGDSVALAFVPAPPSGVNAELFEALVWCVTNDGECLSDHQARLSRFKGIIARAGVA